MPMPTSITTRSTLDESELLFESVIVPALEVIADALLASQLDHGVDGVASTQVVVPFDWDILKFNLPKWVPIVGGKYEIQVAGQVSVGSTDCGCKRELAGQLEFSAEIGELLKGKAGGAAKGGYLARQNPDGTGEYFLSEAEAEFALGLEAEIPAFKIWVAGLTIDVGPAVQVAAGISGTWKDAKLDAFPTTMPNEGKLKFEAGLGGFGKVDILAIEAKLKIVGLVGAEYPLPLANPVDLKYAVQLTAEASTFGGFLKAQWSYKIEETTPVNLFEPSPQRAASEFDFTVAPLPGTTGVFAGNPVSPTTDQDLVMDGAPVLETTPRRRDAAGLHEGHARPQRMGRQRDRLEAMGK